MTNPNIAIKDRWVEAVFAGDRHTLHALADPDLQLYQPEGLPYGGTYRGVDGFFDFLDRFTAAYDLEALEPTGVYVEANDPDRLVLSFRISGVLRSSGKVFASPQLEAWDFRDGRIVSIRVMWFTLPE